MRPASSRSRLSEVPALPQQGFLCVGGGGSQVVGCVTHSGSDPRSQSAMLCPAVQLGLTSARGSCRALG